MAARACELEVGSMRAKKELGRSTVGSSEQRAASSEQRAALAGRRWRCKSARGEGAALAAGVVRSSRGARVGLDDAARHAGARRPVEVEHRQHEAVSSK